MTNSQYIRARIDLIEGMLSPENLYMDGEADPVEARKRGEKLERELRKLRKQEREELKKEELTEQGKIDFNG